mgnify:CR=1 FL=1
MRLAFSVANKDGGANTTPSKIAIMVEFTGSDPSNFARMEAIVENGTTTGKHDWANNRYCVVSKQLQDLYVTNNFTWNSVNTINVYAFIY